MIYWLDLFVIKYKFYLLAIPINCYLTASVWLSRCTIFTITQKHNTLHTNFPVVYGNLQISKPCWTFITTAELFMHHFVLCYCSRPICQNASLLLSPILTLSFYSSLLSFANFSQILNYCHLACASCCLPLANLRQWSSEFLLVCARACRLPKYARGSQVDAGLIKCWHGESDLCGSKVNKLCAESLRT